MSKLSQTYSGMTTIKKIAVMSWITWVASIIVFVALVLILKSQMSGAGYATVLASAALVVTILLFASLMLTTFPQAFGKRKGD